MRLVTTVHGWVHQTRRTPLYYWIDRVCLPRYEEVICVSEDLRQRCLDCGVPLEHCTLIENAIDTEEFRRRRSPEEAKALLGLTPGRFTVGAVGRLSAEKGFGVLIRAVNLLVKQGIDVELIIAGTGYEQPQLQQLTAELGLSTRVHLLGYRPDVRELYEAMDVFALSSYREGLPNVLLEAMAMEVPVVATRIAGIPRLIRDRENGLLVEPGDADGLAAGIAQFLVDRDQAVRVREAGCRTVREKYGFAARMKSIEALYHNLVSRAIVAAA
jgi:glycosyltransferase involved in cell wall biosynthesis